MMARDILLIICIASLTSMCGYFSVNHHDSQNTSNEPSSPSIKPSVLPKTAFLHPYSHSIYD